MTMCGIPFVELEGCAGDWEALRAKAGRLLDTMQRHSAATATGDAFLQRWRACLMPVLDEFARAASGNADTASWRSVYKFKSASGGDDVSGWILALFPYGAKGQMCPLIEHAPLTDDRAAFTLCNPWKDSCFKNGNPVKSVKSGFFDRGTVEQEGTWVLGAHARGDSTLQIKYMAGPGLVVHYSGRNTLSPKLMWAVFARDPRAASAE